MAAFSAVTIHTAGSSAILGQRSTLPLSLRTPSVHRRRRDAGRLPEGELAQLANMTAATLRQKKRQHTLQSRRACSTNKIEPGA